MAEAYICGNLFLNVDFCTSIIKLLVTSFNQGLLKSKDDWLCIAEISKHTAT